MLLVGQTFNAATSTASVVTTSLYRTESGTQAHTYRIDHISGPQSAPPDELDGLKHELVIEELELGEPVSSERSAIKKRKARFTCDGRGKQDNQAAYEAGTVALEGYIFIEQPSSF